MTTSRVLRTYSRRGASLNGRLSKEASVDTIDAIDEVEYSDIHVSRFPRRCEERR